MTDQRGVLRPRHGRCDVGAFERVPPPGEVLDELITLSAATPSGSNGMQSKLLAVAAELRTLIGCSAGRRVTWHDEGGRR